MMCNRLPLTTFLFLSATVLLPQASAYKILMLPFLGKSHVFSMAAIAEGLASRGHRVTLFLGEHFRLNLPELKNRTEISVARYNDETNGKQFDYDALEDKCSNSSIETGGSVKDLLSIMSKASEEWCRLVTMENDQMLEKLHREKFDMAVVDCLAFTKCMYLVPHRLRIPWITYSVSPDPLLVRVPWLPSFVPTQMFALSEQMSFVERLQNSAAAIAFCFLFPFQFRAPPQEVLDKYRPYGQFDSLDELARKSALWLLYVDSIIDYPRPSMPNVISISGITIKRSTGGELPPDIENFVDGAREGVILMTFGSVSSGLPAPMMEKFSSAFRRLDGYRVLWKLNNKDNVELPDNVMISQWLPQNELLQHPSVKLFITHCGNNGQYEAIYHTVPMIGFPILGDQVYNAKRMDHKGYGIAMNLYDFTADELLNNIHKVLGDASYKQRVQKASEIFRSQAQSPVERATFWIEHVCRFGGDHLRSAGNDLPLYSYLMLDVLAFILITLYILVFLLYKLIRFTVNRCIGVASLNGKVAKMKDN